MSESKGKHAIQSDLGRARGLGASHHGFGHWWQQRVTAVSNAVLMLWLVCAVAQMPGWSHVEFTQWLAQPVNAVLMILSVISVFFHAALGTQVITEDYVGGGMRIATVTGIRFVLFGGAVLSIFSILKIALGA